MTIDPGDGINVWIPVPDERTALVRLEAAGIRVAPGTPFRADSGASPTDNPLVGGLTELCLPSDSNGAPSANDATVGDHVRVTVSLVGADVDDVARALALAAAV